MLRVAGHSSQCTAHECIRVLSSFLVPGNSGNKPGYLRLDWLLTDYRCLFCFVWLSFNFQFFVVLFCFFSYFLTFFPFYFFFYRNLSFSKNTIKSSGFLRYFFTYQSIKNINIFSFPKIHIELKLQKEKNYLYKLSNKQKEF